jgi:hypothetical protein
LHRKKCSTSRTRRLSARSPSNVPRGLGSSSDMIAAILNPLSVVTALYFPWICGKCLSGASRGTTGRSSQKIRPRNCCRGPIRTARGTSARAAISIYIIAAIAPVKLRERFAVWEFSFADAIGRPRSSFTSLKTGLICAIPARCLTTRSPALSGMRSDAIISIEINRGSGGRLKKRPQRRASVDRTRNPIKGSRVAKSKFRCLGTKDGTGSAKLPAV